MRLLFVADGRSPFARNWITNLADQHEVHLLSSFGCEPLAGLASLAFFQVAFSRSPSRQAGPGQQPGGARAIKLRSWLRHWAGPLTIPSAARKVTEAIERIQPDLVHAMRIPYEGMAAAQADPPVPFLLSIWGNDFTLHAPASPGMAWRTRAALKRVDGLHTDCRRDRRLAERWGFNPGKPSIVLPGNGGLQRRIFHPQPIEAGQIRPEIESVLRSIPAGVPVIVNPRGFRGYVRNDTFFQSIPLIVKQLPIAVFLCPTMAGEPLALDWVRRLDIQASVHLLPNLTPYEMAAVYRRSQVMVSPSTHDGTPNTLLEAMACGCLPVAGDLESIREWITPGKNGFLIDPADPRALAKAVITALHDGELRQTAFKTNQTLIEARASQTQVVPAVVAFYRRVVQTASGETAEAGA